MPCADLVLRQGVRPAGRRTEPTLTMIQMQVQHIVGDQVGGVSRRGQGVIAVLTYRKLARGNEMCVQRLAQRRRAELDAAHRRVVAVSLGRDVGNIFRRHATFVARERRADVAITVVLHRPTPVVRQLREGRIERGE